MPVLYIDLTYRVVDFEGTDTVEVLTTREEVERYDGITIFPLSDEVLVTLLDIVEAEVQRQLIVEEVRRVTEAEVVAIVLAVGDDPCSVGRTQREVSLILRIPDGERSSVLDIRPRVEEVCRVVLPVGRRRLSAPALHVSRRVDELVLEARHDEGTREG